MHSWITYTGGEEAILGGEAEAVIVSVLIREVKGEIDVKKIHRDLGE